MERRDNGQGQLVKRGDAWSLILRTGKKRKWYSLATKDETEAADKAKAFIEKLKVVPAKTARTQAIGLPLDEVWTRFKAKERCCERNKALYTTRWQRFLKVLKPFGVVDTLQLRPLHVEAYVKSLADHRERGRRLSGWTIKRSVCNLRRILATSGVDVSFFKGVELPELGETKGREAFTDEELNAIRKIFGENSVRCPHKREMEAAHFIGLNTGLRLKDVCLLEWRSIDFDRCVLSLSPYKTRKFSRAISIPICGELALTLHSAEAWKDETGEYVLPGVAKRYLRNAAGVARSYVELLEAASIKTSADDGIHRASKLKSFHSLRHTFISRLADRGVSPLVIQSMSGHSTYAMTERYSHIGLDAKRRALGVNNGNTANAESLHQETEAQKKLAALKILLKGKVPDEVLATAVQDKFQAGISRLNPASI